MKTNAKQLAIILPAFLLAGFLINAGWQDFQVSLLTARKSAPFDGTVYPVKKVPNWVDLSSAQWKAPFAEIPLDKFIDLPGYDPAQLRIPFGSLNFNNSADKLIRNAQVTYSTPYMGNYKLDGQEYAGSHLAVDMKIPSGTPIYAIANGVVVKAINQSSGFGYHIVLRHDDVPSLDNADIKTTYYSGYAHLGSFLVAEGDLVSKGQLIAYSGNSGTATTPHLHFQIDNDQAPWHLYWPFTSKDAADAGVGFWEGVNAALGKDKALAVSVHPLLYVQKYKNYNGGKTVEETKPSPTINNVETAKPEEKPAAPEITVSNDPAAVTTQPVLVVKPEIGDLARFDVQHEDTFNVGRASVVRIYAVDKEGKVIMNYKPAKEIEVKVENGGASLDKSYLSAADFKDGQAVVTYTPTVSFGLRIAVNNGEISVLTGVIKEAAFKDVDKNDVNYKAVEFLKENEVVGGYSDGTFRQENPVTRVEALKFIYEGLNKELSNRGLLEFADTDSGAWYARYILAAQMDSVVKGYSGNVFKPANNVTRAEFLKMVMEAAGMKAADWKSLEKPFADVSPDAWYSGYVSMAKEKNLLNAGEAKFKPNEFITRGEVAQIIYRVIVMQVTRANQFEPDQILSEEQLEAFYR